MMSDGTPDIDAIRKRLKLMTGAELANKQEVQDEPESPEPGSADKRKLRNLLQGIGQRVEQEEQEQTGVSTSRYHQHSDFECDAEPLPLESAVPGEVVGSGAEGFYLVRSEYPLETQVGPVSLAEVLQSSAHQIAFSAKDPDLAGFDPRTALFVDTETIGLAGGTGTVAFLIGVGYFQGECFCLDQCFMRDFDDEEPMLQYLAEIFRKGTALVSYNGKSFDLPLLRTRFIQNRIPARLDALQHLDLVHVARRFWKRRLADCSLGNIEREVLGIWREDDVPSYLIPQMWFEFLRSGDARPLEGVFYHHKMDILSLAGLLGWLARCLGGGEGAGFAHAADRLSLIRAHFLQGRSEDVLTYGKQFLDEEAAGALRAECFEMLAITSKKLQHWQEMARCWEQLLDEFPGNLTALTELAKFHEHRSRDLPRAEALCREALECLKPPVYTSRGVLDEKPELALYRRLERIQRKIAQRRGTAS